MDKLSITILLLCISGFHLASTKITPLRKTTYFPNQDLIFEYKYQIEDKLAYAVCDRSNRTDAKNCTVIREKFPFQGSPWSCNVTLKVERGNEQLAKKFTVVPFGEDKVIIAWSGRNLGSYLKLMTIKMSNCEIINETSIFAAGAYRDGSDAVFFVTYTDYYDVFFVDDFKCEGKSCKITFDSNGNVINEPIAVIPFRNDCLMGKKFWRPLSIDSMDEGIFYVAHSLLAEPKVYNYTVLRPNGSETIVGEIKDVTEPESATTTNGMITVCYKMDTYDKTLNCTQNDINGNLKYLSLKADQKWIKISDIYNLPNDGFLILSVKEIGPKNISYTLMKVNFDDYKYKRFGVPYQKFIEMLPDAQIFKNKNDDYCTLVVTYNSMHLYGVEDFMDLYADCFTDIDFS